MRHRTDRRTDRAIPKCPRRAGHNTPQLTVSVVLTLSIALNRMCVIIGSWEGGGQGYVAYKESRRETERGQYY